MLEHWGVNVGHDPVFRAADVARAGFNSVAIVLQRHVYLRPYISECHDAGLSVCGIVANESFDFREQNRRMTDREAAEYYAGSYAADDQNRTVDVWCIGNETDGVPGQNPESGIMTADAYNAMKREFVRSIRARREDAVLFGVGTVTGQPARLDGYDLSDLDGLDNHAYAQWPESVGGMLSNYDEISAAFGLQRRIVREFGWPHPDPARRGKYVAEMAQALDGLGLFGAWVYCWDVVQHPQPFGLVDHGQFTEAIPFIQALDYTLQTFSDAHSGDSDGATPDDPQEAPVSFLDGYKLGFRDKAEELGEAKVGRALARQDYLPLSEGDEMAFQVTEKGVMIYGRNANRVHFLEAG